MPFNIGIPELILILIVILVVLGPGRLPKLGKAIGETVKQYRGESTKGLPPPQKSRWEKASEKRREDQMSVGEAAPRQQMREEAVEDPVKRASITGGWRLLKFLAKLWKWRRRLP
ncbi:MAG: twin-arginine translocase TatA/TatE family subunit [Candidatus Desulforudaceae bacterium]|nr:twin-arginine translocase TatA/TatE family subunit [Bacillota bacterium]MBV1726843.1 twin-arginine translocase TatA/TatE family subunit [Desulforudis sp.]MDP3051495.1 twin-arginine translocase TatA/TatE family subunit [Eubacteriales bacterium]MDQ7789042.1 twin-arginine translocase TatA/TatE family subunit [Clostridia bacterium]MBU4554822.1 twin-arginine translocase TatA/TatE family subunit [Bacillota bacterium]